MRWAVALLACASAQRREVLEGVEVVWQAPPAAPKGLVALFHASGRNARHWWPHSPQCETCRPLPAESLITQASLRHGLVAVALTAQAETWTPEDGAPVAHALVALGTREGWKLPLYAIGVEAGAAFVTTSLGRALPPSLVLKGAHLQLLDRDFPLIRHVATRVAVLSMPRDAQTARQVLGAVRSWRRGGATVLEHRCAPLALDEAYFAQTLAGVSLDESRALVKMLRVAGYVSGGGFLLADPAQSSWRGVVSAPLGRHGAQELGTLRVVARDGLHDRASALGAALARAYGRSEACADHADAALAFLLGE